VTGDAARDTLAIEVDMAELELALVNLAINAKDAMPGGGKLAISAGNLARGREPGGLTGPLVQLTVADQGKGISEERLARVFEPFFTTKPPGHGTGLGLSQVYGFCKRAGGTAAVESREGEGTSVHLFLPACAIDLLVADVDRPRIEKNLGVRVLLAEDNSDVADATVAVLEVLGCTVRHTSTGAEAKLLLDKDRESFDLLLTDIVMPGALNGVALARAAMVDHPGLGVLLMSGYSELGAEAVAAGLDVVPKPCTPAILASAIKNALQAARAI
jgi:CheY-like chemotaxis protein